MKVKMFVFISIEIKEWQNQRRISRKQNIAFLLASLLACLLFLVIFIFLFFFFFLFFLFRNIT